MTQRKLLQDPKAMLRQQRAKIYLEAAIAALLQEYTVEQTQLILIEHAQHLEEFG